MENDKLNQTGPPAPSAKDSRPQPRTTASEEASCERCGRPLTGRKTQFCSDACRMRDRRDMARRRRLDLLDSISAAVKELRREVLP